MDVMAQLTNAVIAGLVGGVVTGAAAFAAIRVELRWLRRDIDLAHDLIKELTKNARR